MTEYIDRDRVLELAYYLDLDYFMEIPAADVAPVVHAHWELREIKNGVRYWTCSNCRNRINTWWAHDRYCSDCGAKMDGRVKKNDI